MERRDLRPDDIAIAADFNIVRDKWSIGRVLEVCPGPDRQVRNVTFKTSTREYCRPITKMAVIHPAEGDDQRNCTKDKDFALIGTESVLLTKIS